MLQALRRATVAFALLLFVAMCAFAQSDNSSISGIVKDPSGAVVANAKVTVKNEGTAFERQTTSNESGFYTVTNIQPVFYEVRIEATGFKAFVKTRNKLEAAIPMQVNADLSVGQVSESVTVEASAAQLNTESATVGKTVELSARVDAAVLGGVQVTVDGRTYDGTVRTRLRGLRARLAAGR